MECSMANKRKFKDKPNLSKDRNRGLVEKNIEKPSAAKRPRVDQETSTKEHEQVQRQAASTEQNEKDILKEECKKLEILTNNETMQRDIEAEVQKDCINKCKDTFALIKLQNKSKEGERETKTWKNQYNSQEEEKRRIEEEIKSLKEEKRRTEGDLNRLEPKNNELTKQLDSERKCKEDALLKLPTDKSSYEKIEKELKTKCDELEADVARLPTDKSSYEKIEKELKTKCDELEADVARLEEEKKKTEGKFKSLEEEKKRTDGQLKRLEAKNNQLTNQLDNERKAKEDALLSLEEEKKRTDGQLKRLKDENNQLTNNLDNERKAKEDALLRLSSMASNKLRDNNPNIADLSDPNRPTKLSEQFSELYDNEWTDAFDELEKLLGEKEGKEIISYLRDFVLEIHSFCSDISSSKLKTMEEAIIKPSVPSEDTKIPTEILKTIKDGIKSIAPYLLEHTRELILGHLEKKYLNDPVVGCLQHQNVKRYIDKCTEICWYMSVQDPQLVLDGSKSPEEKFDSNKHREYTKKGPYEEFVVWPVLYLYRGGQMLSKGVAQGAKKEIIGQQ